MDGMSSRELCGNEARSPPSPRPSPFLAWIVGLSCVVVWHAVLSLNGLLDLTRKPPGAELPYHDKAQPPAGQPAEAQQGHQALRPSQLQLPPPAHDEFAVMSPGTRSKSSCPNRRNKFHECTYFCLRCRVVPGLCCCCCCCCCRCRAVLGLCCFRGCEHNDVLLNPGIIRSAIRVRIEGS